MISKEKRGTGPFLRRL